MRHTKELYDLSGKVAIVTGGRGLYGSSISTALCEMGATVVIASRNGAACDAFAQTLRDQGYAAVGLSMDLSSDDAIKALCKETYDRFGRIDILVNNAVDQSQNVSLQDATREKLQAAMNSNIQGPIMLCQEVLQYMIPAGSGSIINISSIRGLDCPHFPFYPESWGDQEVNYTTEKWAMVGLTKYMAGRYGKHGVRVNCIAPGGYDPGLVDNPMKEAFVKTYIANTPLGRWANEDDIKGPITFLASDASAYVTGATLVMDGGWTIW